MYDIYLEVCPSRWTGIDTLPDARYPDEDEFEELDEDPQAFTRKTTSSIKRFRLVFTTKCFMFNVYDHLDDLRGGHHGLMVMVEA